MRNRASLRLLDLFGWTLLLVPGCFHPIASKLLCRRASRQITDNRQSHLLFLRRLDQQVNPADERGGFEQSYDVQFASATRQRGQQQNRCGSRDDEPGYEQIERLEGIETHASIQPVFVRGQKNNRRDHAEHRYVAEDRRCSITHPREQIRSRTVPTRLCSRLLGPAVAAIGRTFPRIGAAIGTKWHIKLLFKL